MKLIVVLIAFLAVFQISFSQVQRYEDGPFKTYYKTGEVKTEGYYLNDKRHGKWIDYYINGKISKEYYFSDDDSIQSSSSYSEDGVLKKEIKTEEGHKIVKGYTKSGNLKFIRQQNNGFYKEFSENGSLLIEAVYQNYELQGVWKMFHNNGNLAWEVNYVNGYRDGVYKKYYENEQLELEGIIVKEKKKGVEKRYSVHGFLEWKGYYDNDKLDKTWTHYNSSNKKINEIKFDNGVEVNVDQNNIIEPTIIPDGAIDGVPVYPGCEYVYGNQARKNCMSRAITRLVNLNFNKSIARNKGLSGKYRIHVIFKIGKDGKVFNARARAVHPDLADEAIRIVKSLPLIQPGFQDGEPVDVPYSLPILFQVQ
ncbi:energy transducer TonB [Psychroserpens mesophilus]|uniref:energy transducer TonB n=1 Tax=Psychroserpens mesophilus TaxID=325473 RepID=UPI003D64FD75